MANKNEEKWNAQFEIYKQYLVEEGRFPSQGDVYQGYKTGAWFWNQIHAERTGNLPANRKALLDSVNPAWNASRDVKQVATKQLLVASNWKKHLQHGDVPIDQVLSGDALYNCLTRGIYSCQAYLESFDQKYGFMWRQLSDVTVKNFPEEASFFDLTYRKAVFEVQFPKLDFGCFNFYIATFSYESSDLFKDDELKRLRRRPTYFEAAKAMSDYTQFKRPSEMCNAYLKILAQLRPDQQNVVREIYFNGKSDVVVAKEYNISLFRVNRADNKARRTLMFPENRQKIAPRHPQDVLRNQGNLAAVEVNAVKNEHLNTEFQYLGVPDQPIEELNLSVRSFNVLKRANINTLYELANQTESQLIQLRSMGRKCLDEIQDALASQGLELKPEPAVSSVGLKPGPKRKRSSLDEKITAASEKSRSAVVETAGRTVQGISEGR